MEPATKKRKSMMEDKFDLLTRIYRWNDIEVDKFFRVKQIVNGKALLEDNTGEHLITGLPGSASGTWSLNDERILPPISRYPFIL